MTTLQQNIFDQIESIRELSPNVRTGQLLAHLGFLAEDMFDCGLADIEDEQLLEVLQRHARELSQQRSNVA